MSASTVPSVLPYLTTLFAGVGVADLEVQDGPLYDPAGPYLCVGWDRTDSPGVVFTMDMADYGHRRDEETYDVACLLAWWVADNDIPGARDAVFDAYNAVIDALNLDGTLGDLVMLARPTEGTFMADIAETGGTVELRFSVQVRATTL